MPASGGNTSNRRATVLDVWVGNSANQPKRVERAWAGNSRYGSAEFFLGRPNAPADLTLTAQSNTEVLFEWTGDLRARTHEVQYRVTDGMWSAPETITGTQQQLVISGLRLETTYEFRVRSENDGGYSRWVSTSDPTPAVYPVDPANVTAGTLFKRSIQWTWSASARSGTYEVQYRKVSDAAWSDSQLTFMTQLVTPGLDPNTEYIMRVRGRNNFGNSGWVTARATTLVLSPPVPLSNLRVTARNKALLRFDWDAASDAVSYEYQFKLTSDNTWSGSLVTFLTYAVLPSLTPGTSYDIQVRARNADGQSAWQSATATTLEGVVPTVVTGITATDIRNTEIDVAWSELEGATYYGIRFRTGTAAWTTEWLTSRLAVTLAGLTSGATYEINVRGHTIDGGGPWGTARVTTVDASTPVEYRTAGTFTYTWPVGAPSFAKVQLVGAQGGGGGGGSGGGDGSTQGTGGGGGGAGGDGGDIGSVTSITHSTISHFAPGGWGGGGGGGGGGSARTSVGAGQDGFDASQSRPGERGNGGQAGNSPDGGNGGSGGYGRHIDVRSDNRRRTPGDDGDGANYGNHGGSGIGTDITSTATANGAGGAGGAGGTGNTYAGRDDDGLGGAGGRGADGGAGRTTTVNLTGLSGGDRLTIVVGQGGTGGIVHSNDNGLASPAILPNPTSANNGSLGTPGANGAPGYLIITPGAVV